jgi:hypothetical protein
MKEAPLSDRAASFDPASALDRRESKFESMPGSHSFDSNFSTRYFTAPLRSTAIADAVFTRSPPIVAEVNRILTLVLLIRKVSESV